MTDPMNEPQLRHVQCLDGRGLHRMAYWQWERANGASDRVLVCVHGVSRQGRDFDTLARAMQDGWRVVCPDVVGRGESDRLADPTAYTLPTYVADMVTLLARLDAKTVHWVGTSMGGLIGIGVAALPDSPIARLVLNDVGPAIDPAGIARIADYVGLPLSWASEDEAADYLLTHLAGLRPAQPRAVAGADAADAAPRRRALAPPLRPGHRRAAARPVRRARPRPARRHSGRPTTRSAARRCVLRGAASDVLAPATAAAMAARGPKARVHEFAGVGHAPTIVSADQVAVVREFLQAGA